MSYESINEILLKEKTSNDEIIRNLYHYFDNFEYELFNETYYNDYLSSQMVKSILKENNLTEDDIEILEKNENATEESDNSFNLRRISDTNSYYGIQKTLSNRDLYNYNMLGMPMRGQIFNELDPSTGIGYSYFIMTFGMKNNKIKTKEQYSNLHIILEKKIK